MQGSLQGSATKTQVIIVTFVVLKKSYSIFTCFTIATHFQRFAEKTAKELEDLKQQLLVLTEKI